MGVRKDRVESPPGPRVVWGEAEAIVFHLHHQAEIDQWQWSLHEVPSRGKEHRRPGPSPAIAVSPWLNTREECLSSILEFRELVHVAEVRDADREAP